jgi:pimeloyl-ACP methyl ester carboxylesterase
MAVRGADGTRLHTLEFGPPDGYPIVLSHGITCAIRVWCHQIADLATDYRVIAYDHRGHGRSGVPKRSRYSLDYLASDLDAVLDATVGPQERAVIAGHSMGGIAIAAWSERYPSRVEQRADAVTLINTTTGDLLRDVALLQMPAPLADARIAAARRILLTVGGAPVAGPVAATIRRFVGTIAVGRDADPAIADFVYKLFSRTPPSGRGNWARVLVDELGPRHISLQGLTVPTLVIGGVRDRLLPIVASRRIASAAPKLTELVELPGGHCSILEQPRAINRELRGLVEPFAGFDSTREITS